MEKQALLSGLEKVQTLYVEDQKRLSGTVTLLHAIEDKLRYTLEESELADLDELIKAKEDQLGQVELDTRVLGMCEEYLELEP